MNYEVLIQSIVSLHEQSAGRAAAAVNRALIQRNWLIGAHLVEYEQGGEDRAEYGAKLLPRLARDLRSRGIGGASRQMLDRMRSFYRVYPQLGSGLKRVNLPSPICSPPVSKSPPPLALERVLRFSWTHVIDLLGIDDPWKRAFYENECLAARWSVRELRRQVGSLLYERTALSTDKRAVIEAARGSSGGTPPGMADLIRDPYVLEFVGLAEKPAYRESDLETALLDHLRDFLLELGNGFCLEARQKRITVGNAHDYIDLVFYHRRLRCHLLIDLKVRAFEHGDAGQMNFYLNYWKANELAEGDQPPVGLLLCSDRDSTKVEYAIAGMDQQMFVSRYLVALPSPQRLRELIEADRAGLESGVRCPRGEYGQERLGRRRCASMYARSSALI